MSVSSIPYPYQSGHQGKARDPRGLSRTAKRGGRVKGNTIVDFNLYLIYFTECPATFDLRAVVVDFCEGDALRDISSFSVLHKHGTTPDYMNFKRIFGMQLQTNKHNFASNACASVLTTYKEKSCR